MKNTEFWCIKAVHCYILHLNLMFFDLYTSHVSEMGNGKKLVNEYCMNNYGFTCTTSMEGSSLKARAVFWKVSPKEDGYYEMETEKGMFPVLQQLMPQMTEDAWKELIKNGGVAMK